MTTLSNNIINQKLENKTLLVRVDLNVPVVNGKVQDDSRIKSVVPSIKHIINNRGKVVLCSHFGRPDGEKYKKYSLRPMSEILSMKKSIDQNPWMMNKSHYRQGKIGISIYFSLLQKIARHVHEWIHFDGSLYAI